MPGQRVFSSFAAILGLAPLRFCPPSRALREECGGLRTRDMPLPFPLRLASVT